MEISMPDVNIKVEDFNIDDIDNLKNPAYIVRDMPKGKKSGGCVIRKNTEFETLTNLGISKDDIRPCYEIFEGIQEQDNCYVRVCYDDCELRRNKFLLGTACVIKNLWINSKYNGDDIKRFVDVFVFPFSQGNSKHMFALHILADRGKCFTRNCFNSEVQKKGLIERKYS